MKFIYYQSSSHFTKAKVALVGDDLGEILELVPIKLAARGGVLVWRYGTSNWLSNTAGRVLVNAM